MCIYIENYMWRSIFNSNIKKHHASISSSYVLLELSAEFGAFNRIIRIIDDMLFKIVKT